MLITGVQEVDRSSHEFGVTGLFAGSFFSFRPYLTPFPQGSDTRELVLTSTAKIRGHAGN